MLIGCLFAVLVAREPHRILGRVHSGRALAVTLGLLLGSLTLSQLSPVAYRMSLGFALEPVLMGLLLLQLTSLRPRTPGWAWLDYLGRISYGMYLFQQLTMRIAQGLPGHFVPFELLAGFALTIAVASLSYRLYERPFLELKKRYHAPARAAARGARDLITPAAAHTPESSPAASCS